MGACGIFQGSDGILNLLREVVENVLQLSPSQPHLSWPSALFCFLFSLMLFFILKVVSVLIIIIVLIKFGPVCISVGFISLVCFSFHIFKSIKNLTVLYRLQRSSK